MQDKYSFHIYLQFIIHKLCIHNLCIKYRVKSVPVPPFPCMWPAWNKSSRLCFQLLPWHLSKFFPFFHLPPLLFSSIPFVLLFLFHIVLSGSNSKLLFRGRGTLPWCMSNPLLFPQFYLHWHCFLLCISPQSSSEIMLDQKILKIFLSHLFMNVYRSFVILCGTFLVQAWHYFKQFAAILIKCRSHQNVELQDFINLFTVLLAFSLNIGHAFLAVKKVGRQVGKSVSSNTGQFRKCLWVQSLVFQNRIGSVFYTANKSA